MEKPNKNLRTLGDLVDDLGERVGKSVDSEWEFEPVDIETFVNDPMYLDFRYDPNTKIGCRPCVMQDLKALFGTDPHQVAPICREAFFSEAIGTGKSTKIAIACCYLAYKLLCLYDPIKYLQRLGCQLKEDSKIAIMVMARTESNAKEIAYDKVNGFIMHSQWFQDHYMPAPEVNSKIELDAPPRNRYRFDPTKKYKNIHIVPGSSSEYSALGYDIFVGVLDEVTKFAAAQDRTVSDEDKDQAEILFAAIQGRIVSRYENNGLIMCVGNPEYKTDFLERHTNKQAGKSDVYIVKRRSQWNSKMPEFDADEKLPNGEYRYPHFYFSIDKQRIVPERLKRKSGVIPVPYGPNDMYYDLAKHSPEIFTRDYAGYPTAAVGQYASDVELIENHANTDREPTLKPGKQPDLPNNWVVEEFERKHLAWHSLHIDLGEVGDPAAFCLSHPYGFDEDQNPLIYVDMIYRFEGTPSSPFQIRNLYDWVDFFVAKKIPIGIISADTHQSTQMLQTFNSKGFATDTLSLDSDRKPYDNLVQAISECRVDYYYHDVLDREYRGLERHGDKIVKPRHGTDDVFQAVAGSVWQSMKLAVLDPPEGNEVPGAGEEFTSSIDVW